MIILFFLLSFFLSAPLSAEQNPLRSFNEFFPLLDEARRETVFNDGGLVRTLEKGEILELIPGLQDLDLYSRIMQKNPAYLAEALVVVPYSGRALDKLDAYNSLQRVRDLKGLFYRSYRRRAEVPLFEDATRLDNTKMSSPIPDPPPLSTLPQSETFYIRLKDTNFGNTYYRADLSVSTHGIIYNLTNFKKISFLFFTVLKEGNFTALMYMEPLLEGMMIYVVAGADVSNFVASRISVPSAIAKRGEVFIEWVSENLKNLR